MAETAGGIYYPTKEDNFDLENDLPKMAESVEARFLAMIPAGSLVATARSSAPAGYLLCDGAAVSRITQKRLFEAIGTTYGTGDGTTTFNLPDLRGRVPVGVDGAAGRLSANDALGNSSGEEKHVLTEVEMPGHSHVDETGGFAEAAIASGHKFASHTAGSQTGSTGGGTAHNNMQPYQVVNYLIKT